ncbi:MAG: 23S rRNA (adenine(2503)-C(2))-methyltransferase RlmN [Deltaproteobacteria bacterium]|nr:23S rRNA (adenine(2503)-C(2))-methyltransferase RlmN [Deltaproteobacteria bacterium]
MIGKPDIMDLSPGQLQQWLVQQGMAAYRGGQILRWIYGRQVDDFEQMTDLSKTDREKLKRHFEIGRLVKLKEEVSRDGSRKYLFGLGDGQRIESVLIPERGHHTLCVSSQVGCALGCRFCLTGEGGFIRNLSQGEIIAQVRDIQAELSEPALLTNIVLMGMGEPLANYANVTAAVNTLTDNGLGFRFAGRRVTLSTAGLVPQLMRFGRDTQANIAVSLNAADNRTRDFLMPINKTFPIEKLLAACCDYPLRPHRRITFEYILIKGVNDSESEARRLAALLRPIRAKINLIPFNPHSASEFERPEEGVIERFQQILLDKNYTVIVRRSKGTDISAACGQLIGNRR